MLYAALLSWWSPFTADTYHHALTGMEHRFDAASVWEHYVNSYLTWNPRLGELAAFALATVGKGVFVLLNPMMILGLVMLMFYAVTGRRPNLGAWADVRLFGLTAILLLTCTARPGVTLFWLSGAVNYGWAAVVLLSFLSLYRPLIRDDFMLSGGVGKCLAIIPLGFLAGMTNEPCVPATWVMLGGLFIYVRLLKKRSLPVWFYGGAAAHLCGALCLLMSPGLAARKAAPIVDVVVTGVWDRLEAAGLLLARMHEYHLILPLVITLFFTWLIDRLKKNDSEAYERVKGQVYLGLAYIATAYVMTLSYCVAVVPCAHALFPSTLMFGLGLLCLIKACYEADGVLGTAYARAGMRVFLSVTALYAASAVYDHYSLYRQYKERECLILTQKAAGAQDIKVPALKRPSPWCTFIFWVDYEPDPNGFVSRGAAKYYGVHSVSVAE